MLQASTPQKLKYFASADLPPTPAERFGELFLAQTRWKKSDIVPFLRDIALDEKECEKLLLKYTRMIMDSDGIAWYTSRGGTMN
jgi:sister chromatid cohesion protein DCC1